jgi:hypothetical protein
MDKPTQNPQLPPPSNLLEILSQKYALMALAGGDQLQKDGRRDYLLQRFKELDQEFPGLRLMIIERIKAPKNEK